MANDFKVQFGVATILVDTTSITITAGTEYTAPSAITAAFVEILSSSHSGAHTSSAGSANARAGRSGAYVSNPGNLLTSITLSRFDATATATAMRVSWQIIEYIGQAGGANEMIVRAQNVETIAALSTTASRVISGVATAADVVMWITGQSANAAQSSTPWSGTMCTAAYNSGTTSIDLTRLDDDFTYIGSWAAVEFTGSNWTVQRVSHTFSAVDTTETETLSSTGSLTRTFSHSQMTGNTTTSDIATLCSYRSWVNSTTQASFRCTGSGVAARVVVLWVISNSQTDGTPMVVQRVSGTRTTTQTSPWNDTITAVSSTDIAALTAVTSYSDDTTAQAHRGWCDINPSLTNTTTVQNNRGRTAPNTTYDYEVVEFPTISAQSVVPVLLAHYRKRR